MKLYLNDLGLLCAAGNSKEEVLRRLLAGDRTGLVNSAEFGLLTVVGRVNADLPVIEDHFNIYQCRNNQLLLAALSQISETVNAMIGCYGAERIGVVLGTSTSGVRSTELALKQQAETGKLPEKFHYKQ